MHYTALQNNKGESGLQQEDTQNIATKYRKSVRVADLTGSPSFGLETLAHSSFNQKVPGLIPGVCVCGGGGGISEI